VDDGLRSGYHLEQLPDGLLVARRTAQALAQHPQLAQAEHQRRLLYETIRRMLSDQVYDGLPPRGSVLRPQGWTVPRCGPIRTLVASVRDMARESQALKQFLFRNLYRHAEVTQTMDHAQTVVQDLFSLTWSARRK
jgi:dGTPase